jgi:hypothetical protein
MLVHKIIMGFLVRAAVDFPQRRMYLVVNMNNQRNVKWAETLNFGRRLDMAEIQGYGVFDWRPL